MMRFWAAIVTFVVVIPGLAVLTWNVSCQPYESPSNKHESASNSIPPTSTNKQSDPAANHQTSPVEYAPGWCTSIERPEWWSVYFLILTGIAIAYQALKMRETTEIMIDTTERQLRAYVCVTALSLKFTDTASDSGSFEVLVQCKNSGQTPAYEMRQWIAVIVDKYPLSIELPEPPEDFEMSSAIIAPGGTAAISRGPGREFRAPFMTIGGPTRTVWAYGKITYRDAFGNQRFTKYRFLFGGNTVPRKTKDPNGELVGIMGPHTEGNEAD